MSCTMSAHTSPWSSIGVHDSRCDNDTERPVGLYARTESGAVIPAPMVIDFGAVHVSALGPNGGGDKSTRTPVVAGGVADVDDDVATGRLFTVVGVRGDFVVPGNRNAAGTL